MSLINCPAKVLSLTRALSIPYTLHLMNLESDQAKRIDINEKGHNYSRKMILYLSFLLENERFKNYHAKKSRELNIHPILQQV